MDNAIISKGAVMLKRRKLQVGHRLYITIIKELSGSLVALVPT